MMGRDTHTHSAVVPLLNGGRARLAVVSLSNGEERSRSSHTHPAIVLLEIGMDEAIVVNVGWRRR